MLMFNETGLHPSFFLLIGIPGLETLYLWMSIPFCVIYSIILLGNSTILFIIKAEQSLHTPMYYFLCMLAFTDLVLSSSVVLKLLSILWFNSREIHFDACLIQMFVIHMFSSVESGVLLCMAFDRYIAICDPLRYAAVLTNPAIVKLGLMLLIRGAVVVIPCPVLASRLPYCRTNVISHSYCDHMAVAKISCADITVNSIYGITVVLLVIVFDVIFITVSYVMILRAVLALPSRAARHKAFSTCTAHICVILFFYMLGLFSFLTHRIGHNVSPYVHVLLANLYLLVPPMLNPIVYGVNTKDIRIRVFRVFSLRKMNLDLHT